MVAMALAALAAVVGGGALSGERVTTPEGWYQVEDGYGETSDSEVAVVAENTPSSSAQPPSSAPPAEERPAPANPQPPADEIVIDCEEIRGRYLQRVLELHGVPLFGQEPKLLAAWTHRRPGTVAQGPWALGAALADPALAPLYGEPPVPSSALGWDFTLQNLALELLRCDNGLNGPNRGG
jgi:hypothetical protein